MKLQLIRNATMVFDYSGKRLLTDPDFAPKHMRESFTGKSPNPICDMPIAPEKVMEGLGMVLVSHLHSDHFDKTAQAALDKDLPLLCQPGDEGYIVKKGFKDIRLVNDEAEWEGINITRVTTRHGLGEVEAEMGKVSGFVLRAEDEPTIFWAGDSVLCDEVREAIAEHKPDVILTHSAGATWPISNGERALIIMDDVQTIEVAKIAPGSKVIAIHLDSMDHATVGRAELRAAAKAAGLGSDRILIPEDGETLTL